MPYSDRNGSPGNPQNPYGGPYGAGMQGQNPGMPGMPGQNLYGTGGIPENGTGDPYGTAENPYGTYTGRPPTAQEDPDAVYNSNGTGGYDGVEVERRVSRAGIAAALCVCGAFLIAGWVYIGYSSTSFYTDSEGQEHAAVADLDARNGQADYNTLKPYYKQISTMFRKCAEMDSGIQSGKADAFSYSSSYSDILTQIDSGITAVQGANVNTRYSEVQNGLADTYNSLAVYCQKMSKAVTDDSYDEYTEAQTWYQAAQQSFNSVSAQFVSFGQTVCIYNDPDLAWYQNSAAAGAGSSAGTADTSETVVSVEGKDTGWSQGGQKSGTGSSVSGSGSSAQSGTGSSGGWESIFGGVQNGNAGGYGNPVN